MARPLSSSWISLGCIYSSACRIWQVKASRFPAHLSPFSSHTYFSIIKVYMCPGRCHAAAAPNCIDVWQRSFSSPNSIFWNWHGFPQFLVTTWHLAFLHLCQGTIGVCSNVATFYPFLRYTFKAMIFYQLNWLPCTYRNGTCWWKSTV
jgi:hypothetical protein